MNPAHAPGRIAKASITLAFLVAPWSGVSLVNGSGISIPEAAISFSAIVVMAGHRRSIRPGRLHLPREFRGPILGGALLLLVFALGSVFAGLPAAVGLSYFAVGVPALLWLIALARIGFTLADTRRLAQAFVLGVAISAVAGVTGASGRLLGLAGHQNRLAMSAVVAIALAPLCITTRHKRLQRTALLIGALAWVVLQTGSRSGMIGAVLVVSVMGARLALRRMSTMAFGAVGIACMFCMALAIDLPSVTSDDGTDAIARFAGDTATSDQERLKLLERSGKDLTWSRALIGGRYYAGEAAGDRSPHNVVLEVWLAGGLVGLTALAITFGGTVTAAVRVRRSSGTFQAEAVALSSLGVVGFLIVLLFNNALFAPFGWAALALACQYGRLDRSNRPMLAGRP